AEDGIRAKLVTGVQTCALPIFGRDAVDAALDQDVAQPLGHRRPVALHLLLGLHLLAPQPAPHLGGLAAQRRLQRLRQRVRRVGRSEERRVGKEWMTWWCLGPSI